MSDNEKPEFSAVDPFDGLSRRDVLAGAIAISVALSASSRLMAAQSAPQSPAGAAATLTRDALAQQFLNPPMEYAPVDLWWWEGARLEKEKLTLQLEEMKDRGIGGSFFYPRWVYGESLTSDPAYWTKEWWDLTRFSLEEHERLGLTHYFSNWTLTQFQQDLVRKEKETNPTLEGRALTIYAQDGGGTLEIGEKDELLEAAAYRKTATGLDYASRKVLTDAVSGRRLRWNAPGPGWMLTAITIKPWDLNYLDKAVGERFAEAFLGEYARHFPEHIGKTLRSFGADEMILLNGDTAYSPALMSRVRSRRGYDPAPYLIALFHDIGPKTDQIRCDYYDAMTALLEENFYQAPGTWLESRGMIHSTVSQLGAGNVLQQIKQIGDMFRYLRTFHLPGNEDPWRTEPGKRRLLATKLSSSIAHLYERQRAVGCVHYASGWGQTQAENLAWTYEAYAKGLNFYNRHGNQYTLMAGWYEWVPPSDHFHQPTWRFWKPFTREITRLSYVLSQGKHRADVALLYPITTIHAHWLAGRNIRHKVSLMEDDVEDSSFAQPAIEAAQSMEDLAEAIYHDGIDFNFLDNDSLERATVNDAVLEVAGVEFRSIVLPTLTTIRLATMTKVREFYEAGGTVVSYGRLPTASAENGRDDPELAAMVKAVFGPVAAGGGVTTRRNERSGQAYFVPADVNRVPSVVSNAIVRDVTGPGKDLFHIHRKAGEADIYFLFNVREEARELPIRFRAQGNPEIWDSATGTTRPAHRWKRVGEITEVQLRMGPNEGVVLVFSPGPIPPSIIEDNVLDVVTLTAEGNRCTLQGFDETPGIKKVRVACGGQVYTGEARVEPPPRPMQLTGLFGFRLEPTMNNRWGDFRYPASHVMIGAEARRFRYAEESEAEGTESNWHRTDFDDRHWPEVTYSYGPYWWHLGPFATSKEPKELLEQARRGEVDVGRSYGSHQKPLRWQPQVFSRKFGSMKDLSNAHLGEHKDLLGVAENFLILDQPAPGGDTHYFLTHVQAPAAADYWFAVGTLPDKSWFSLPNTAPAAPLPAGARAWINGNETALDIQAQSRESRFRVPLREGLNIVLLEVVRPKTGPVALYATFFESEAPREERYVPLVRWFREPQTLVYDLTPEKTRRVGWYRFKTPPGLREIRIPQGTRVVQAWIDGESVSIEGGKIALATARRACGQAALRIEQEPGAYAGAAFADPVTFECESGQISLGDWSTQGLPTYSGVGVYSREVHLESAHLRSKVILDLGSATSIAEVWVNGKAAGVKLAPPFRFDVTDLVETGSNILEIKVANTLANHMSTYPTQWVLEGQTVSGLLGPVELRFQAPVSVIAKRVS